MKVAFRLLVAFSMLLWISADAYAKTYELKDGSSLECPKGSALRTVKGDNNDAREKWVLHTCDLKEGTNGPFVVLFFSERRRGFHLAIEGEGYLAWNDVDIDEACIRCAWNKGHVTRRPFSWPVAVQQGGFPKNWGRVLLKKKRELVFDGTVVIYGSPGAKPNWAEYSRSEALFVKGSLDGPYTRTWSSSKGITTTQYETAGSHRGGERNGRWETRAVFKWRGANDEGEALSRLQEVEIYEILDEITSRDHRDQGRKQQRGVRVEHIEYCTNELIRTHRVDQTNELIRTHRVDQYDRELTVEEAAAVGSSTAVRIHRAVVAEFNCLTAEEIATALGLSSADMGHRAAIERMYRPVVEDCEWRSHLSDGEKERLSAVRTLLVGRAANKHGHPPAGVEERVLCTAE